MSCSDNRQDNRALSQRQSQGTAVEGTTPEAEGTKPEAEGAKPEVEAGQCGRGGE